MANWCYNSISFSGSKKSILLLIDRIEQSDKSEGILIHSSDVVDGYFFDVVQHESQDVCLSLTYESKWDHNYGDVAAICKEFGLTAHAEFEEPSNNYYGECDYYADGTFKKSLISQYFFAEVEFSYETDQYEYRGGSWDYVDNLIQDEYLPWVKELLQNSDRDTADTVMNISENWLRRAVGNYEDAEAIIRLLTSTDIENVMLGLTFYNTIVKL